MQTVVPRSVRRLHVAITMHDLPLFQDRHQSLHARLASVRPRLDPIAVVVKPEMSSRRAATRSACVRNRPLRDLLFPVAFGGDGHDLRATCNRSRSAGGGSCLVDAVFAVQGLGS